MLVTPINLSLIDFEDKTFYTGNKDDISSIKDSILELGLLNSPILRENKGRYQIICGWKRLISCRSLGHSEVLCSIYSSDFSDQDALKAIFLDNRDRLSELELAELIMLHKTLCKIEDTELMGKVLPLFDIPPKRKYLDKFLALACLQKEIREAFFEDIVTIEQCQMLSELQAEDRPPILDNVLLKYKLNSNESRQVIQYISEIALKDLKSVLGVINEAEIALAADKIDKNQFRAELKRMRYPDLTQMEEKVKNIIKDLELPQGVNLVINQFFEANDIELRIKAKSAQELLKICSNLESLCNNGDIDKLISIIKGKHNGIK